MIRLLKTILKGDNNERKCSSVILLSECKSCIHLTTININSLWFEKLFLLMCPSHYRYDYLIDLEIYERCFFCKYHRKLLIPKNSKHKCFNENFTCNLKELNKNKTILLEE